MILIDTSVWIEILNGRGPALSPDDLLNVVTCGPVAQEVLQGLVAAPESEAFRNAFLALPRVGDPVGWGTFLRAADIYRQGRRKGHTIRSSVDCLIAAIAIENKVAVWHRDRDFTAIAKFTELEVAARPL